MDDGKRQGILEAAAKAFGRLGFRKTSIADIAAKAGVAKGTIYLCAKSKEDLFYQVLLRDMRDFIAQVSQSVDPRIPADQLLRDVTVKVLKFAEDRPLISDLITGVHHVQLPGWEERLDEIRALGRANVAEILNLGIRQGCFRMDLDVEKTAEILQDLEHAVYIFHRRSDRPFATLMETLEVGMDLALNGLRTR